MRIRVKGVLAVSALWFAGTAAAVDETPFLLGPPSQTGPVEVRVGFYLSDVNEVDEENQRVIGRWQ